MTALQAKWALEGKVHPRVTEMLKQGLVPGHLPPGFTLGELLPADPTADDLETMGWQETFMPDLPPSVLAALPALEPVAEPVKAALMAMAQRLVTRDNLARSWAGAGAGKGPITGYQARLIAFACAARYRAAMDAQEVTA